MQNIEVVYIAWEAVPGHADGRSVVYVYCEEAEGVSRGSAGTGRDGRGLSCGGMYAQPATTADRKQASFRRIRAPPINSPSFCIGSRRAAWARGHVMYKVQ